LRRGEASSPKISTSAAISTPLNYDAGRQPRERVSAYESAILTRGIIDFLLVPRDGPLFLTKKAKLGRSALLEFTPAAPVIF